MKDIMDDFGKGFDLGRSEIMAYRSSQRVVFSKEAGIGRQWDQVKHYVLIYRHGTIHCVQQVTFKADSMKQKVRFMLRRLLKKGKILS